MGSLKLYGAVAGLGKGLGQMAQHEQELEKGEQQTQREIQLQRMRDKGALERQREAERAAQERQEAEWGPEGYRESFAESEAARQATEQRLREQHQIVIEEMRQREQTARERLRITENQPEFEWHYQKAERVFDPMTNSYRETPERWTVQDRGGTYTQVATPSGPIFVPSPYADSPPGADQINEGKGMIEWLITAPDDETRISRKQQFLRLYHYLPSEYFDTYDPRGGVQRQVQRDSASGTTPAVNQ